MAALWLALLQATPAWSQDIHGRVELGGQQAWEDAQSLSASLGCRSRSDVLGDLRLTWEPHRGSWSLMLHYELSVDGGDTPTLAERRQALAIFHSASPATWLSGSDTFIADHHLTATQRIDRFAIGYAGSHFVLRLGRQALTWGSGLVFHPMDLFDPFAPTAIDTEYKPGVDMAYAQWLFDDGSDLQFVAVPRSAQENDAPTSNASSYALHFRTALGSLHVMGLLARDHGDGVAGVGINGPLHGATWNIELVPTFVRDGPTLTSALANMSYATTLSSRNVTWFGEYYRNGFGLRSRHYPLNDLPAPLRDRLVRGQVFETGRDYLAGGVVLQWTPLLEIDPTLIANVNDASFNALVQMTYSLRENLNLVAGLQLPMGPHRTEFGGVPLTGSGPPFYEQPRVAYVQLRRYF